MPEFIEDFELLNRKMQELYTQYVTFAEDILRFIHLYKDFVDNFLNSQHRFLDSNSLANIFIEFIQKTNKNQDYLKFSSGFSKFSHSVIKKGYKNILCETYEFKSLGAFLYFDLFRGIENKATSYNYNS